MARSQITVRVPPALEALLALRIRQGERLSEVVRRALEAYLGMRHATHPTDPHVPPPHLQDLHDRVMTLTAALAEAMRRLQDVEQRVDTLTSADPHRHAMPPHDTPPASTALHDTSRPTGYGRQRERVQAEAQRRGRFTCLDIASALGETPKRLYQILQRMVRAGELVQEARGKGAYYHIVTPAPGAPPPTRAP